MSAGAWVLTGLACGLGAVLRLLVDERVRAKAPRAFPTGILVVNLTGALVSGILSGAALAPATAFVLITGFVGSYSTFSTWMLDVVGAAETDRTGVGTANLALSLVLGLGAAALGIYLGGLL